MGLFGGYKQKEYDNNTALFHKHIELIYNKCSANREFLDVIKNLDKNVNVISKLHLIDNGLDVVEVIGKINWKELEAIDNNIMIFIQKLQEDIRNNKPAMFVAHLNMLMSVVDSRISCVEPRDAKAITAETKLQESCALISDVLQEKVKVVAKMTELEQEGAKLDEDDPALEILELKYTELESRLETLNIKAVEYRNTYNDNLQIVNKVQGMEEMYAELEDRDIETPQAISKRIADLNRKGEARMQRHDVFKEQFSMLETPTAVSKGSSFKANVGARKQADLEKGIDAADGIGSTGETKSSFRTKIGK